MAVRRDALEPEQAEQQLLCRQRIIEQLRVRQLPGWDARTREGVAVRRDNEEVANETKR